MGEQIKLLCSETSPSNNGKDLKDIFINRFKLPDGFWNDLFDINCPEGLGKVNEKLKNGEDLSANDFKSLDESSINDEDQCSKNKQSVLQFKTPILVKSHSNANHSPSLFSPQDYEMQKGPSSSTPLPGKLVCAAEFRITPKTTKNNAQNDYQTPECKLLGYTPYNTKTKTQKLSASLAMDPLEQMNLSWSSSLATPPGPGCPKQQSMNTILDRKCSFELSGIQMEQLDTIRVENPLEELDSIKVQSKFKSKPKGVARILFEKEIKSVRYVETSNDLSFENSKINGNEIQCQNMSEDSGHRKPNEDAQAGVNSLNHFDMSSLSPLQEKAVNELFALADTRRSPGGIKTISNFIKNTLGIGEEKSTLEKAFMSEVVHEVNNVRNHLALSSIKEHAEEASENDPDVNNTINENVKTDKDFKNLIDMDALSEFPMDFDLSHHITVPSTSNQGENVHAEIDNVNSISNNDDKGLTKNLGLHLVPDGKIEGPDVDASKIYLTDELLDNEVSKPEEKRSDNSYDMDALSEFPMDFHLSQNIKVPDPDYGNCNKDDSSLTSNSDAKCIVVAGQSETSTRKMETASQVLRDLSLRQLSDITFDERGSSHGESKSQIIRSPEYAEQNVLKHDKEVNKTLTVRTFEDEQNGKLKIVNCFNVGKCQNGKNPFVGFLTASGKKVTISEKSMQRAKQLLNEVNKEEKNSPKVDGTVSSGKVGVSGFNRREVGGQTGQVNKPTEKAVSVGFCTASGGKVDVSMKSLNKARQIIHDVVQEESKESKDVRKSVKVSGIGVSPALKNKFEVPSFMSNDGGVNINEKERDKLKSPDKQRQHTANDFKFSTASGKEVRISRKSLIEVKKSILDDFEHVPELSQDFLKDVENIFIDLEKETCPSKGDKGPSVIRGACAKEGGYLGNAKHIPNENGESGRICRLETSLKPDNANYGFLPASEKVVAQSEKSLKKGLTHSERDGKQSGGAPGNNIGGQLDTPQKNVTGKSLDRNEVDKNLAEMKPTVVSAAPESIAERVGREEAVNNALVDCRDVKAQGDTETNAGIGFFTASDKKDEISRNSLQVINESDTFNIKGQAMNVVLKTNTASGNKVTVSEELIKKAKGILSDIENEDCCKNSKSFINKIPNFGFSTASGNESTVSEESLKKAQMILNEVDNEGHQSARKATNNKHNIPCSTASAKNKPVGFTTASGKNVTVSEASIKKVKSLMIDKEYTDCSKEGTTFGKIPKFGFSTASGKEISVSEESLKKAQMILNEVDNEGHQSERKATNRKHNIPCSTASAKNKPVGFTTASGKNVTVSEASIQKAKRLLSDKENVDCSKEGTTFGKIQKFGFSTASGKEISVSDESLKKARKILNEVDSEGHQSKRKEANEKHKIPYSIAAVKNPPVSFTTVSGNKINVSEAMIQKAKSFASDKENEDCSKKGRLLSKIPKFEFSTASGNEIAVSEESLRKARKILNEVDNEGDDLESKSVNEKHSSPFSTASATNAKVGFTTASGNNVTISEASIQNAKRMLDDKVNEEERSLGKVLTFGFATASGNEIAISEESLKKARRILNDVDNEEPQLNHKMGKPGVATRTNIRTNIRNARETENVLDSANSNDHKSDVWLASTFQKDIPRSGKSLCDKTSLTPKQTDLENENDIECRRTHKRLSSEIETENGRACKACKTDKETETRKDGNKWMRFKRFDPLVTYRDRKRSNNPSRTIAVSPNLESTNQVASCDQLVDVKTPINANSKSKSGSHFITPYRAAETIVKLGKESKNNPKPNNANTPLNGCTKSGEKKTKSAKQDNEERLVKPQPGSIYKLRTNACSKSKRISFAEYVSNVNQQTSDEPERHGVSPSVMWITCENAESYRFKGSDFLSEDISTTNTGVTCTEGAVLFLGEDKCAGLPELTKAFLSSPGVDPKLISEEWIANHYKWIIWKLASYERSYPQSFSGRTLTPDMVLSQLKYRYDREVDHCERSAIKKILERDDSSSRSMVLCVASLDVISSDKNNESEINCQNKNVELQRVILMTDSWYSIRVQLDEYLQNLVREKKIYVGQKLYIQGAELRGSDQAVSPLEAPSNLHLRIHGNSTRPAKKFSRLGFHCKNSIFTVPIKSLSGAGGHVSSINVIVARQYPLQFMEKFPDGKCIFRNPRCEERIAKKFEDNVHRKREKIMFQVQKEIDNEETKTARGTKRKSNSLSTNQIENLTDGIQIFDAISNASDPFHVQKCLSDEQRRILDSYKENLQNDRADIVRRKYEKAWSKLSEEETLKRNVVPVLKVKLVDCLPSKTNQTPGTALLTVWRPSEQTITTLGEGKRLKIYSLQVSKYKGNNSVQLSANRGTIYKALPSDATCQNIFEARKVFTFTEISNGLRPNVEVDVVAIVISQLCQHNLTLVYMADSDFNLVRIKVWGGLESQGLQDVMKENNFIAACNLLSQPDRRSGIASLKYCELSLVTSNPSNKMLRNSLYELRKAVSNPDSFITKAKAKLDELCHSNWSTPKAQNIALLNGTSSESAGKRRRTNETPPMQNTEAGIPVVRANGAFTPSSSTTTPRQSESLLQSRKRILHSKRRKLDLLGDPSPISPIPNALPASVRKAFQVPRRIRTQADDMENEEE